MERTVHGLEPELRSFQLRGREHYVAIILFVAAQLPKLALRNVWSEDQTIPALLELFAQIVFHLLANRTALRVPHHEALPVLVLNRKQIQFAAQPPMIALLGFLA